MADYTVEELEAAPYFDLELLLGVSQESRISHETMDGLSDAWDRWLSHARVRRIEAGGKSYLLAWLDESVEADVDDMWEDSPSEAFMYNALAQVMCMGLVHALLPEVEDAGCAPAPRPTDELTDALEDLGVPYLVPGEPGLARRFAVVTHYPFRGACEICMLLKECPKAGGGDKGMSLTLPGHEK